MKDDVRGGLPISQEDARRARDALKRSHRELEQELARLRQVPAAADVAAGGDVDWFDYVPVALVSCDGSGRIQTLNRKAVVLMRTVREQLLGTPLVDFVLAEDRGLYVDYQCRLVGQAVPQACEVRMLRADGSAFWAGLEAVVAEGGRGGANLHFVISDITQRKQAEERLVGNAERYRLALSALSDGLWEWHIPSGQAFFNEQYYALLGYEDHAFPATYASWRDRVHPSDIADAEGTLRRSVEQGLEFELHFRMCTKGGVFRWMSARGKVVDRDPAGASVRMVGTLTDIHVRKQMEMALLDSQLALMRANEALEQRVCERTAFLRETVITLEQEIARRQQKEHELSLANERLGALTGQLRALAAELTMAEHRERRRLSATLHDHLQPMLASVKLRVAALARRDGSSQKKCSRS